MLIREATEKDVFALSGFIRHDVEYHRNIARYYDLAPDFDWAAYTREKLSGRDGMILVGQQGEELGGFIHMRIIDYHPSKEHASFFQRFRRRSNHRTSLPIKPLRWGVIEECYVMPSLRRQGIGRELTAHAVQWFRRKDISRIELSVLSQNTLGEAFWKENGFETFRLSISKAL